MVQRSIRLFSLVAVIALLAGIVSLGPRSVEADASLQLPHSLQLVENAAAQSWEQMPASAKAGRIEAIVHLDMLPLAVVGRDWTQEQRVAYVAQIRAAQDAVIPQIEAMGGTVHGRFFQAATGLAISIEGIYLDDLRGINGVVTARGIGTYELDLSESVPFIGASAVQDFGFTGRNVSVAVIDSGVDYTHVKLGGPGTVEAYAEAYCGDASATPDPTDPACNAHTLPDTSGYFGDPYWGRTGNPINKVIGGWDWVGELWPVYSDEIAPDSNPIDFEGHGTHVADIIAGLPGGGVGPGVAPGANIWAFKACSAVSSSCNGLALLLAIDDALDLDDSDFGACQPGVDAYCKIYDPADVINMSLGSIYGQPEDDLTLFTNIATYYGSVVVASAGNSADKPYIVGSPSAAAGAISVAQTTMPSDKLYQLESGIDPVRMVWQAWSAEPVAQSAELQYGDGAGGNVLGCSAFPAGSLAGKIVLLDRGACAISIKVSNAAAGGAIAAIVANNVAQAPGDLPPSFSFGGGDPSIPGYSITLADGNALKAGALGTTVSIDPNNTISLAYNMVSSSSRGPRIADGAIKPDIGAPGGSISAEVGTGSGVTAFSGTSGAAPMVAGTAALLIEKFRAMGIIQAPVGIGYFPPLVKSLLMNTSNPNVYLGGTDFPAPITRIGAGQVDVANAFMSNSIAIDATDALYYILNYFFVEESELDAACFPGEIFELFAEFDFGFPTTCSNYPFGNDYMNAKNSVTGSLSFGYEGVVDRHTETRTIAIGNFGETPVTYDLSAVFRYEDDKNRGVRISFSDYETGNSIRSVTVPPMWAGLVNVTLTVDGSRLRGWGLNSGERFGAGTNQACPTDESSCPTLTLYEYDGYVVIDGGENNTLTMPWQILPKRSADVSILTSSTSGNRTRVRLYNDSSTTAGDVDMFNLVEVSPNNCEIVDENGECINADYVPGILPGVNVTAIDMEYVGARSYTAPGLGAAIGFPGNDTVAEFAVSVHDKPYRASNNFPVEFDIYVDSDKDGVDDYVVFNYDVALTGSDGRNAVFVADINPIDGTSPLRPYFYTRASANTQNWILPVPAAAIGITNATQFNFYVLAFDSYFGSGLWDVSPIDGGYHSLTLGLPKFRPIIDSITVPARTAARLSVTHQPLGITASPSQIGLLFFYRNAPVEDESEALLLP